MFVMTYSQARQNFSTFLDAAKTEGIAYIKRADGSQFKVLPIDEENLITSPFEKVKPVSLKNKISMQEIIDMMHEGQDERADRIIDAASRNSLYKTRTTSFSVSDSEPKYTATSNKQAVNNKSIQEKFDDLTEEQKSIVLNLVDSLISMNKKY